MLTCMFFIFGKLSAGVWFILVGILSAGVWFVWECIISPLRLIFRAGTAHKLISNLLRAKDQNSVHAVFALLRQYPEVLEDSQDRRKIAKKIAEIGTPAIKPLIDIIKENTEETLPRSIIENGCIKILAAIALVELNDISAIPVLQEVLLSGRCYPWVEDEIMIALRNLNERYLSSEGKELAARIICDVNDHISKTKTICYSDPIRNGKLAKCPYEIITVKSVLHGTRYWLQYQSFASSLLSRLYSLEISDRKEFLEKLFVAANPPSLDVWTLQKGWQVGTALAVTYMITNLCLETASLVYDYSDHQFNIDLINDLPESKRGLVVKFFYYDKPRGMETFVAWKIVRTNDNEYFCISNDYFW